MNGPLLIGFSRGIGFWNALLGKTIRTITGGVVNHAFFLYQDDHLGWMTIGATPRGIDYIPLDKFKQKRQIVAVYSTVGFDLWDGLNALKNDLGIGYNYGGLVGEMIVVMEQRWFHKFNQKNPMSFSSRRFCSQWCTDVIRKCTFKIIGREDYGTPVRFLPSLDDSTINPEMQMETIGRNTVDFHIEDIP